MAHASQPAAVRADLFVPAPAVVEASEAVSATERLLTLCRADGRPLGHAPGQFVQVGLFGIGEAPISIASAARPGGPEFQLCVRRIGRLTAALHALAPGDRVGIRGPYGHGFDLEAMAGRDVLFIAGGIGLAPLRSLLEHCLADAKRFGRLTLLYGARGPAELLFRDDLAAWAERGLDVRLTVDRGDAAWTGRVGLITTLIEPLEARLARTAVAVCGPPIMYRFVLALLDKKGLPPGQVQLSLERRMRCGVGKCGHCTIGPYYCCIDGPVFTWDQVRAIPGAL